MAPRKRGWLDDASDSSDEDRGHDVDFHENDDDPDARAERELFDDPYGGKRRRRGGGKEDALYGVFAEDDDEDGEGFGKKGGSSKGGRRVDWTKYVLHLSFHVFSLIHI